MYLTLSLSTLATLFIQATIAFHVNRNVKDIHCPSSTTCTTRHYFIQAEEVEWDYAPSGMNQITKTPLRDTDAHIWNMRYKNRIGSIYKKAQYIGYTDNTYSTKSEQPEYLGILGPIVRAEVGDVVYVHFKNTCEIPFGIHSHGVRVAKQHEGATYGEHDQHSMMSSAVNKGSIHTYTWIINEASGPGPADGNSSLWAYHSHNADPGDIYSGLFGPIIIYRPEVLDKEIHFPKDVEQEFVLHFLVFDENESPYLRDNILTYAPELTDRLLNDDKIPFKIGGDTWVESNLMHSINGRMFGNLNGLDMKSGSRVRWHVMGFGNEVDIHTVHWHSQTLLLNGHRTDVVELLPATFRTLEMMADNVGEWMLHCHVMDHQMGGMVMLYNVLNDGDSVMHSMVEYRVPKTDMNVRAAPRPPMAQAILSINAGMSLTKDRFMILISIIFILI